MLMSLNSLLTLLYFVLWPKLKKGIVFFQNYNVHMLHLSGGFHTFIARLVNIYDLIWKHNRV